MRNMLLASAALAGLLLSVPAFAQTTAPSANPPTSGTMQTGPNATPTGARPGNVVGTGNSLPMSSRASNIDRADTRSDIAPQLPVPPVGPNATPQQFLSVAQSALQRHRTGEAEEALERAETRLLDRSTAPANANTPDNGPMIQQITDARQALGHGDTARASQIVSQALAGAGGNASMGGNGSMGNNGAPMGGQPMGNGSSGSGTSGGSSM